MTFVELGVHPELITALSKQQITEPMPIQVAALPVLLAGKDAYLHAETGTGKTLAYLLPLFCRLDAGRAATQVVIVAPTHELAIQIQRQCCDLAQNAGWPIRTLLLIGGTSMERQVDKLKKKPHVVVGSPGRICDLIGMEKLKMAGVRSVVIDEADRLMGAENLPAIQMIIKAAPRGRQLLFASATEEPKAAAAIATLAPELQMLQAGAASVNENIEHLYLVCEERNKPEMLRKLVHALRPERAMVFAHRNETAERVAAKLAHHKIGRRPERSSGETGPQAGDGRLPQRPGSRPDRLRCGRARARHKRHHAYLQPGCSDAEQGLSAPRWTHRARGREGTSGHTGHR